MSPFIGPIRVVTKVQLHYINQYGRTTGNVIFTFLLWVEEFVHLEIVSLPVAVDVVPERRKHVTDQKKKENQYHQSQTKYFWLKIVPFGQRNPVCLPSNSHM